MNPEILRMEIMAHKSSDARKPGDPENGAGKRAPVTHRREGPSRDPEAKEPVTAEPRQHHGDGYELL